MCDHCRSSRMPNGRTSRAPVQEKSVAFATSLRENVGSDGANCGQWKKSCCGGGCCGRAMSNEPCCGRNEAELRQAPGMNRQYQQPSNSRSLRNPENNSRPSGCPTTQHRTSCGSGYDDSRNERTSSCGTRPPIMETGVCPAMMRNLPCTPLPKPKCFGGDCRDDDTDSEHSREI